MSLTNPWLLAAAWVVSVLVIWAWFYAVGELNDRAAAADEEDWMWPPRVDDQRRD